MTAFLIVNLAHLCGLICEYASNHLDDRSGITWDGTPQLRFMFECCVYFVHFDLSFAHFFGNEIVPFFIFFGGNIVNIGAPSIMQTILVGKGIRKRMGRGRWFLTILCVEGCLFPSRASFDKIIIEC